MYSKEENQEMRRYLNEKLKELEEAKPHTHHK